jgi:hypothetical protein
MYRNITLNASLTRQAPADAGPGTQANGDITIHSASDDSGSEPFDAALPFQCSRPRGHSRYYYATRLRLMSAVGLGPDRWRRGT